jgi:hypothetical protein
VTYWWVTGRGADIGKLWMKQSGYLGHPSLTYRVHSSLVQVAVLITLIWWKVLWKRWVVRSAHRHGPWSYKLG